MLQYTCIERYAIRNGNFENFLLVTRNTTREWNPYVVKLVNIRELKSALMRDSRAIRNISLSSDGKINVDGSETVIRYFRFSDNNKMHLWVKQHMYMNNNCIIESKKHMMDVIWFNIKHHYKELSSTKLKIAEVKQGGGSEDKWNAYGVEYCLVREKNDLKLIREDVDEGEDYIRNKYGSLEWGSWHKTSNTEVLASLFGHGTNKDSKVINFFSWDKAFEVFCQKVHNERNIPSMHVNCDKIPRLVG